MRAAKIRELMAELQSMPEQRIVDEIKALQASFYIYSTNHREISDFMQWVRRDSSNADLWSQDLSQRRYDIHLETVRQLHNYVASACSLVDHTRLMYKRLYKETGLLPEYEVEVQARFQDSDVVQFLHRLRQIVVHHQPAETMLSGKMTGNAENELGIAADYIRRHQKWLTRPAKRYLSAAGDVIDLPTLIESYHRTVVAFYEWLGRKQSEIHAEDFRHITDKERQMHLLEIEDSLDHALDSPRPLDLPPLGDRGIFHWVFSRGDYEELERFPPGSVDRADQAIKILEGYMPVPPRIRNKIRRAYSHSGLFGSPDSDGKHDAT